MTSPHQPRSLLSSAGGIGQQTRSLAERVCARLARCTAMINVPDMTVLHPHVDRVVRVLPQPHSHTHSHFTIAGRSPVDAGAKPPRLHATPRAFPATQPEMAARLHQVSPVVERIVRQVRRNEITPGAVTPPAPPSPPPLAPFSPAESRIGPPPAAGHGSLSPREPDPFVTRVIPRSAPSNSESPDTTPIPPAAPPWPAANPRQSPFPEVSLPRPALTMPEVGEIADRVMELLNRRTTAIQERLAAGEFHGRR